VWLDSSFWQPKQGPILLAQPSWYFTILLDLGPKRLNAIALLNSRASTCFLDEEFVKTL